LQELLAPQDVGRFLKKTWGKSFVHIAGPRGRFRGLLPWDALNAILEEHDLQPQRFRLYKKGVEVERSRYQTAMGLKFAEFQQELAMGSTLIIDAIDQFFTPLRDLMSNLESMFHSRTTANLYAAWRKDNGFTLHWDQQDTMIVQVCGRKRWKVYPPTAAFPLLPLNTQSDPQPGPSAMPVFDMVLDDGHLLHLPRGYWHVAYPVNEPSIHLTITVAPTTGLDFLQWIGERVITQPEVRMNIPLFGLKSKRKTWLNAIRRHLRNACLGNILDQFLATQDAKMSQRSKVELPGTIDRRSLKRKK
jgi:ribosomal protein L16 Arg81 hydroxylase